MRDDFKSYLVALGMSETLMQRVEEIYEFYTAACPEEIKYIFVTDLINADNVRSFENIWFFSEKYAMEAKEFINSNLDDFDLTAYKKRIYYWNLKKEKYNFKVATDASRATFGFRLTPYNISGTLKASRNNCDYLKKLLVDFFNINLLD